MPKQKFLTFKTLVNNVVRPNEEFNVIAYGYEINIHARIQHLCESTSHSNHTYYHTHSLELNNNALLNYSIP